MLVARASASVSVTRSQLTAVHDHRETTTYRALSCERARGGSVPLRHTHNAGRLPQHRRCSLFRCLLADAPQGAGRSIFPPHAAAFLRLTLQQQTRPRELL